MSASVSHRSRPKKLYSVEQLRRGGARRLPRAIFDFFDGGAEDELSLRNNRTAYENVRLRPRTLIDVSRVDPAAEFVGGPAAMPIGVGPTGAAGYVWPGGDIAIARAAVEAGLVYTLSTSATASIEAIARAAPGRLWFQAYILRDKDILDSLIRRAWDANYEGLMITVDLPVGGKRERDARNELSFPFRFTAKNILDFALHPGWSLSMLWHGAPVVENLKQVESATRQTKGDDRSTSSVGKFYDPSFSWDDLQAIRARWSRKLIVKGIVHPEDGRRVADLGADAIVVSNHGGRQMDGVVGTLDALPGVLSAVAGRIPVLVDGGVRRGSDVLKALALGAQGVMIGRPTLYGAMVAGYDGAAWALEILRDEFERSLQLCGMPRVAAISDTVLFTGQKDCQWVE